jgi:diguanylate cyclase (GGDEF)-like protein
MRQDWGMVRTEVVRQPTARPAIAPRDRHTATRTVAYFMLAGALFVAVLSMVVPGYGGAGVVAEGATYGAGLLLAIGGWFCWHHPDRLPDMFWNAVPVGAAFLIGGLNLITADASAGAQLFFLWPVFYAATFLRPVVLYVVLACVLVAEASLVYSVEGPADATADLAGLMTVLTMASVIIVTLRRRLDRLLDALESQALQDGLTGLPNRRAFDRDFTHAVAVARRSGETLSLLTIDIDHFKAVNDTSGHAAGDRALQCVASALRTVARESDVLARIGGDEFVALLIDCDERGARRLAAGIQAALAGTLTLSIGVATLPDDANSVETLSTASDAALYDAKVGGRNRIVSASQLGGRRLTD